MLTNASCRTPQWRHLNHDDQRDTCATCPALAECETLARQEVAQSTESIRADWRKDPHPDVWAGRTLIEWVTITGKRVRRRVVAITYDRPKRFCDHGHDTHEVGVYTTGGQCVGCARDRAQRKADERRAAA